MADIEALMGMFSRSFNLGQEYWRLGDSEYLSDHKRAESKFKQWQELQSGFRTALTEALGDGWKAIDDQARNGDPMQLFSPCDFGNAPGGLIWISGGFQNGNWRGNYGKAAPTHCRKLPPPPKAEQ